MNDSNTVRFSVADLEKRSRSESRTDLARLRRMTESELEEKISTDADWAEIPADWHLKAEATMERPKKLFSLWLDADVLAWFKSQGAGYQTRMNAVLRSFMEHAGRE